MRLSEPRVPPITEAEMDDDARELAQTSPPEARELNIVRTLWRHPALHKRWREFTRYILRESTLPARVREQLILRTGWLCRAEYEFEHHVVIAKGVGVTDEEIERVKVGPDAEGWSPQDAVVLRAADELHNHEFVSDATWEALSERFSTQQLIDVIFTVGQYHLVSMALNTLGVQLEEGVKGFE